MKKGIWFAAAAAIFFTACEVDGIYLNDFLNNINLGFSDADGDGDSDWGGDTDWIWETDWDTGWSGDSDWVVDTDWAADSEWSGDSEWGEDTDAIGDSEWDVETDSAVVSSCGNGIVDPDEQCDDGLNDGSYGNCAPGCVLGPYCGDGVVNGDEQCDDGNRNNRDQCSNRCRVR
jgi:cysteine-rich repeat protein